MKALQNIKVNQEMTHQREVNAAVFKAFCQVSEPINSPGKLAGILAKTFIFANNHWREQAASSTH